MAAAIGWRFTRRPSALRDLDRRPDGVVGPARERRAHERSRYRPRRTASARAAARARTSTRPTHLVLRHGAEVARVLRVAAVVAEQEDVAARHPHRPEVRAVDARVVDVPLLLAACPFTTSTPSSIPIVSPPTAATRFTTRPAGLFATTTSPRCGARSASESRSTSTSSPDRSVGCMLSAWTRTGSSANSTPRRQHHQADGEEDASDQARTPAHRRIHRPAPIAQSAFVTARRRSCGSSETSSTTSATSATRQPRSSAPTGSARPSSAACSRDARRGTGR